MSPDSTPVPLTACAIDPSTHNLMTGLLPAQARWPTGVQACVTTREQGVSVPPFDSWNLGDHVGDRPDAVSRNRELLGERIGVRPVFLRQVHGTAVVELGRDSPDGLQADACWTRETGLACTVMTADCLPLLLSAPDGCSVAAVHAGWRGLLGQGGRGVLEALCEAWPAARTAGQRSRLTVWLGPCIGPAAFEVGAEVRDAFLAADPHSESAFRSVARGGSGPVAKFLADLPLLARLRLARLGIENMAGNDGSLGWCTVSQESVFFSHRRDAGRLGSTGRMAACIWRG
jgi:polyphenol oxidase